jgi:outer membrane immunogenic protein
MKRKVVGSLFGGAVLAVIASVQGFGADLLPVYKAQVPGYDIWTACYAGVNVGDGAGESRGQSSVAPGSPDARAGYGATLNAVGTYERTTDGFTGGGEIGCNYRLNRFVVGAEGDFGAFDYHASRNTTPYTSNGGSTLGFSDSVQTGWLGTVRGRLGFLVTPTALLYGTGGGAFTNETFTENIAFGSLAPTLNGSTSSTRTGWTAGGGIEFAFMPQWTAKIEYLYADFGNLSFTNIAANGSSYTHSNHLTENIVRVGVNWHY